MGAVHLHPRTGNTPQPFIEIDLRPLSRDQFGLPDHREDQQMKRQLVLASHRRRIDPPEQLADLLRSKGDIPTLCLSDVPGLDCGRRVKGRLLPRDGIGKQPLHDIPGHEGRLVGAPSFDSVDDLVNVCNSDRRKPHRPYPRNDIFVDYPADVTRVFIGL